MRLVLTEHKGYTGGYAEESTGSSKNDPRFARAFSSLMPPLFRLWPIFEVCLAVLATPGIVSSSWRKPNVTLSFAERMVLADAALKISVVEMVTVQQFRSAVCYQMADFDALAKRTMYAGDVQQYISGAAQGQETDQETQWNTECHGAIRAYNAYRISSLLELATESWTFARSNTVSDTNLEAGAIPGKDFSLQPTCQGARMIGGTFQTSNSTDATLSGFASTYFLFLSALLAEATSDPNYLNTAFDSVEFIVAHLLSGNLVQSSVSADLRDNCALNNTASSSSSGLMIQGLAVLYSITKNASTQALLNNIITATISNENWQTPDGIIAEGPSQVGDTYLVRGLTEAYERNAISSDLRGSVHDFLGVQFNAVIDLATSAGTAIYGGAWTGPPSAIFSPSDQTSAISVLLSGMVLSDSDQNRSPSSFLVVLIFSFNLILSCISIPSFIGILSFIVIPSFIVIISFNFFLSFILISSFDLAVLRFQVHCLWQAKTPNSFDIGDRCWRRGAGGIGARRLASSEAPQASCASRTIHGHGIDTGSHTHKLISSWNTSHADASTKQGSVRTLTR
ncbi:hypothetical protein B0H14DRAFT_3140862 [Mycena olivaceomarginata]|nr:hypothetical protein B0H14DRAFT_3140862 [Mycena olivaceomarginata]